MHDSNDPPRPGGGLRPTLPSQPRPGLRSTLPSQPAPGAQTATAERSAPAYGHQAQERSYTPSWQQQAEPADRRVVYEGGADGEKRTEGVKNIIGGAVLIAIGLAFGGSVFLGNPEPIDYFFDGLGSLWILKGFWDIFTA